MSHPENYYVVLQVDPAADPEVIESAYRRLARKYHPDVSSSPDAVARMAALNEAYATLGDPTRRVRYDRQLNWERRARRRSPSSWDPRRAARTAGGQPLAASAYLTAAEAIRARAAEGLRAWALEWSAALEALLAGDARARERMLVAGQRCLTALGGCLASWESLMASPPTARLGQLGTASLSLEMALVRGTLTFADSADFSLLPPLAGLAERIGELARSVGAEVAVVRRLTS